MGLLISVYKESGPLAIKSEETIIVICYKLLIKFIFITRKNDLHVEQSGDNNYIRGLI